MKYCVENGLDFTLYRLGAYRIKKTIWREYGVNISIKDKRLDEVVIEAMTIEGG